MFRATAVAAAFIALSGAPAVAQRQQPTPEQRIERIERQLQQVQRQVFPRGRPAETAGLSDEPAATQASVLGLDQRLAGLERQLADTLRQAEENGNRVRQLEAELSRLRGDQERRLVALETAAAAAAAAPPATTITPLQPATTVQPPRAGTATPPRTGSVTPPRTGSTPGATVPPVAADDPAEVAYDEGFQLWRSGRFDEALTSLRAFSSAYPRHRRTSWANNLAGRALLDKGEPRAAAEALLANYRTNPSGERAADSLFYLGQALMKLGQPGQACNAYSELEGVFGAKMRDELKRLLPPAKVEAKCG
jgi:TolA-binding protein